MTKTRTFVRAYTRCPDNSRHHSDEGLKEIYRDLYYVDKCVYNEFEYQKKHLQEKTEVACEKEVFQKIVRKIAENLAKEYSHISTYEGVFGGEPHLKGHRFAVTDVLAGLIVHNSFDSIINAYGDIYTEEQLKQAVRYALYFIKHVYCHETE